MESNVYGRDNLSVIDVNGKNYYINLRGVNIVVFDKAKKTQVDSVCFDTHVKGAPVFRKDENTNMLLSSIETHVRNNSILINNRFDRLEKKLITELKKWR